MACNLNQNNCAVCPGMWIAGLLLLFVLAQNLLFPRTPSPDRQESSPVRTEQNQ